MVTKDQALEASRNAAVLLLQVNRAIPKDNESALRSAESVARSFDTIRAFIEQSQPVQEGFVLVPVEPTEQWAGRLADGCEISVSHAKDTIETVLAAAPKQDDQ